MVKKSVLKSNKEEIIWNIINSGLAGLLVFLGSLTTGSITWKGISAGVIAALIVASTKFKEYWGGEKGEYATKIFTFIN